MDRVLRWLRDQFPDPPGPGASVRGGGRLLDLTWVLAGAAGCWIAKFTMRRGKMAAGAVEEARDRTRTD